jgi:RNA polymerase sigma-70 factor (ECF subfamily)
MHSWHGWQGAIARLSGNSTTGTRVRFIPSCCELRGRSAAAEELTQEVFLRLWRNAGQYQSARGSLVPWLLTVARNFALDHLRSAGEKQRRQEETYEHPPAQAVTVLSEEWLDRKRMSAKVRETLASLPGEQREVLELAYFKGLSHSEISAATGRPLGTVKTWVRLAVSKLRQDLGGAQ